MDQGRAVVIVATLLVHRARGLVGQFEEGRVELVVVADLVFFVITDLVFFNTAGLRRQDELMVDFRRRISRYRLAQLMAHIRYRYHLSSFDNMLKRRL